MLKLTRPRRPAPLKLGEMYRRAVAIGIANDWRGPAWTDTVLARARAEAGQPRFNRERLFNPFGDTRLVWGDPDREIRTVRAGINAHLEPGVDLCLAHHVVCRHPAVYYWGDILLYHKCTLAAAGVPESAVDAKLNPWMATIGYSPDRAAIDRAQAIGLPLMNIHAPCDILFETRIIRTTLARRPDAPLAELAAEFKQIAEIRTHPRDTVRIVGDAQARLSKHLIMWGGGWYPPAEVIELAFQAGVKTVILCCIVKEYADLAARYGANLLVLPHDATDHCGLNLMLDEFERIAPLTVMESGEFKRIRREH